MGESKLNENNEQSLLHVIEQNQEPRSFRKSHANAKSDNLPSIEFIDNEILPIQVNGDANKNVSYHF